jgi:alginate O-acetyltransferase complex protein AlgI
MIFNSFIFWAFFALVILLYWRLPHRGQNALLLVASYVFYGYWDWRFLGLLFASTVIDFSVAIWLGKLDDPRRRKTLLAVSMVANLGFLGFFKYFNFFVDQFAALLIALGFEPHMPTLRIVLPVGISFYTFQTMSYVIDVYRGRLKPCTSLLDFATFIAYFPQLVAGPIERAEHLLPQITGQRRYHAGDFEEGLYHVLIGLFKKVVIADNVAPIVNYVFDLPASELSAGMVMLGVYAFAFQIYGDFSGYSSMAQGISKWMGITLSWNFKHPYFAKTPSDFWQRWHISLSSWLRDYLYIPLGGNRSGPRRTLINLMLTMLLGGLWHGAAWTFIIWGFWHGAILIAYRVAGAETVDFTRSKIMGYVHMFLMFQLVCIGWLFFRAESFTQAFAMLGALGTFTYDNYLPYGVSLLAFFVVPLMVYEWRVERKAQLLYLLEAKLVEKLVVLGYCVMMLIVFPPLARQVFIYFQF